MHKWPNSTIGDSPPRGGIGEAVCATASMEPDILVHGLAVQEVPQSGKSSELLDMFGISAKHITVAMKCMLTKILLTSLHLCMLNHHLNLYCVFFVVLESKAN